MQTSPDRDYITQSLNFLFQTIKPILEREKERVARNNHRAAKKGQPATLTLWQWLRILQRYNWSCPFCRGPFETMEHLVRLADGGGTTAENVVPCCTACNQQRGKYAQQDAQIRKELVNLSA